MKDETIDISILLSRVAQELAALEESGRGIERCLGKLTAKSTTVPKGLQDLDRHVQRLGDLAALLRHLAGAATGSPVETGPLATTLKLEHSRAALLAGDARTVGGSGDDLFFDA